MPLSKEKPKKKSKTFRLTHTTKHDECYKMPKRNNLTGTNSLEIPPRNPRTLFRSTSYADNETILLNSIGREDVSSISKLLETGKLDVNVLRNGMAPIHHACATGNVNVVKLITQYGANTDLKTGDGQTPIKLAVLYGHFEVAEYLISLGVKDVDIVDGVQ